MKRAILLYPLVLAALPVVLLAAENASKVTLGEVVAPIVVILAGTVLLTLFLKLFIKNDPKVSVIVSIFLLLFFSYGHFYTQLSEVSIGRDVLGRHRYLMPVAAAAVSVGLWSTLRYRGDLTRLVRGITLAAFALILVNAGRIGLETFDNPELEAREPISLQMRNIPVGEQLPDIYYIILDAYARADVLLEIYEFDNSAFLDALTDKGFYVAPQSRANYMQTTLSLPSSLNMQHLYGLSRDEIGTLRGEHPEADFNPRAVGKSYAGQIAANLGYEVLSTTGKSQTSVLDHLASAFLSPFSAQLARSTLARNIPIYWLWAKVHRQYDFGIRGLLDIAENPEPTFALSYNYPPHPPYIFDRDGRLPSNTGVGLQKDVWVNDGMYIDQLIYVNKVVEGVVDSILQRSSVEPIIIIQSDHGPMATFGARSDNPSDLAVFERSGILNAYYLPEYCRSSLYPTITPVNTFRLVFDKCLGTDFGLLEDTSFWSSGEHWDRFAPLPAETGTPHPQGVIRLVKVLEEQQNHSP